MVSVLGILGVVVNDRFMSYTNDQCHHLVKGVSRRTLCGCNSGVWGGKIQKAVNGGYLCPRCERSAIRQKLTIPYREDIERAAYLQVRSVQ